MIKIFVDNREIEAEEGANLLRICLDHDIYIPNLCYVKGMEEPPASCRLCFVDIEGEKQPVTACTVKAREGLRIRSNTPEVRSLQAAAFELIMSTHRIECGDCPSKGDCVLIRIGKFLKVKLKPSRVEEISREKEGGEHPYLIYDPSKCIICGRCIYRCGQHHEHPFLTFAGKGLETGISFFGETDSGNIPCKNCLACVDECPVSALISYKKYEDVVSN